MTQSISSFSERRWPAPTVPFMSAGNWRQAVVATLLALVVALFASTSPVHAQEGAPAVAATQVNINTADAQTLAAGLKGVGASRAQDIVRYRETFGPFASAEELMEVKGIGQSTLDRNRAVITLE